MLELQRVYPFTNWKDSGSFHLYAIEYRADSLIARKNYREAINTLSEAYSLFIPANVNQLLSLKFYIGDDVDGRDLLFLHRLPKLNILGSGIGGLIIETSNNFLDEKRKELGSAILPIWAKRGKESLRESCLENLSIVL